METIRRIVPEWTSARTLGTGRSLACAASGGQALCSGASKGQQSIDDWGLPPLRSSMASPYLYSTPIAEQALRQGTPMASEDGQLCETPAAQALRAASS
jgi:hypothetical protein